MELLRALASLAETPSEKLAPVAEALELGPMPDAHEYTELFIFNLYPYASVYLGPEGMIGGEARSLIAGFWRTLGQSPPPEADHLALMLALYARLVELEEEQREPARREGLRRSRKAFLWEHLLSWLPIYLSKLDEVATPFYRRWGRLLTEALVEEAREVGPQRQLPLHLRDAPGLCDPRDEGGFEDFLAALLAPVRSGIILLRPDLTRAARRLDLGLRIGERRFMLKALFGQDAPALLGWLSDYAAAAAASHQRAQHRAFGEIPKEWARRAADTHALMDQLRREPI